MRKEFRIGFGIGGVLLAVLVVALVVRSHSRPKPPVVTAENPDAGGGTDTTPKQGEPLTSTETSALPTSPVTPTPPVDEVFSNSTIKKPDDTNNPVPSAKDVKDPWDQVLLQGTLPTPAPTVTPEGHSSGRVIGNHFGDAGTGPAMTPGSFPPGPMLASETSTPARTPSASSAGRGAKSHTIVEGETFSTIAKKAYGSSKYYLLIEKANPNVPERLLRPGTVITLPELPAASEHADRHAADRHIAGHGSGSSAAVDPSREYVVKSGDSLYRISMRLYATASKVNTIYELNKDRIGSDPQRLKLGMTLKLPGPPTSNAQ